MNRIITFLVFFTFLFLSMSHASGQNKGTEIKIKFKNFKDSECYLGFNYGNAKYIKDTTKVNHKGEAIFKYDEALAGGIYLVILPSKNYFEIIVAEPVISLETDTLDFIEHMNIIESEENKLFYEYMHYMKDQHEKRTRLINNKSKETDEEKKKSYDEQITSIGKEIDAYVNGLIESKPNLFWCKLLKAMKEPIPRDKEETEADSSYQKFIYNWYQQHFFDNLDFTDNRYIRTPIYERMIMKYMNKLTMRHPDSLKFAATRIIDKTLADTELFKFTLIKLFNKYAKSKYMGMDAVYVYLAEKYYLSGKATWADSTQLANMWDRVYKLSSNQIGMKAKELIMKDSAGVKHSLYDIDSRYTVLIFWDPDCGHCRKILPLLKKYYNKTDRDSVEVYSVFIGTNVGKWRKYIKDNNHTWISVCDPKQENNFRVDYDVFSTPVIYLLNHNKVIKAKRIDVEHIPDIINTLEGKSVRPPKEDIDKEEG